MNHEENLIKGDGLENAGHTQRESLLTIPVIQEQVQVTKEVIETARVKISKVVTEHQEHVDVPLTYDEVNVERVPINQFVETLPEAVRYEGETMIIPILQEVMVKRILLVEEVRVSKRQLHKSETQDVILRKEEVKINREEK